MKQLKSFGYAIRGIYFSIITQRNMKIHVVATFIAITLAAIFNISNLEWMLLSTSISLVLMAEMVNTSIETTIDLATKKRQFRAMVGKDVAAGAVLITCLNALVTGYLIFFERLSSLIIGGI
ncbi:diacylglycerol kinase family protein [bacterium]|jgi:diacylglycerol kinase (ATP)|nr:diacylglycerol kinase family protein [bacterium]